MKKPADSIAEINAERLRLEAQHNNSENWRQWGPYLAERAWGTVREDYSPGGNAWEDFNHDQARSRAYRWNEDGLGGICDEAQTLCFALALWNGRDPILKERAFGLTGNEGNHGEDVKEAYFYKGALPSHAWLQYLYKYPQAAYPYQRLVEENARRSRAEPAFGIVDSGALDNGHYWDVEVTYAKASPTEIHIRIAVSNRSDADADLCVLPQLWFRNTWSWDEGADKPVIALDAAPGKANWAVGAEHPAFGRWNLYGQHKAECLFTENESNAEHLWGTANAQPYVKDAFHRYIIEGDTEAVNPAQRGSKFAACHRLRVEAGHTRMIDLVLSNARLEHPFERHERVFAARQSEFTQFYDELLPDASPQDARIMRQAFSGLIWNKQFFHYDVARWLDGDRLPPPVTHRHGRNQHWRHLQAGDIISMPDKWEYPWFAAWDLAFHCAAFAQLDVDFAKEQIELLVSERYMHPNGQIPAYEWAFGDTNPPVHAMGALKVFRAERVQRGVGDFAFLKRVLHKLLLNYAWWINRKDADGNNVFGGGFLGLDNISVYDRSQPLPPGFTLKQADATGWMAMFALNLTAMALEITTVDPAYEGIAIQSYNQFLAIAGTIAGHSGVGLSLWDDGDGFFKDLVVLPDGSAHHINVFSWVGIIPLFACEVIDKRILRAAPRFADILAKHGGGGFDNHIVCNCPAHENERGEHFLSLVDPERLTRILTRVFDESQFLSPYGVRSVSRIHAEHTDLGHIPGIGRAVIEYVPGESTSGLFGGNSNWRGPVWMPTNYMLIQALEKYQRYLGDAYTFPAPCLGGESITLKQAITLLSDRVVNVVRRDASGRIPAFSEQHPMQHDPHWRDLLLLNEYYHADTGLGLGAQHQAGWTALVANLVFRRYREDIPEYWLRQRG